MYGRTLFLLAAVTTSGAIVLCSLQYGLLNWLNVLMITNLVMLIALQNRLGFVLSDLLRISGLQKQSASIESSLKQYILKAKASVTEAKTAISGINEIGQDKFVEMLSQINDSEIQASLQAAHDKIVTLRKKEKENNWITEGVAAIAELKQKGNDIGEYSLSTISTIVKYLNANQGAFFLLKSDDRDKWFELTAAYAYGTRKYVEKKFNVGEGLIGQIYYEKEIICITDVPKDYIRITSGLGEALPRCVCILPLMSEGELHGAIEVASFQKLQSHEMEYLKKIADSIGYNLASLENNKRTEILLEESQKMAQEVKSQEEELRQNMEELKSTQEQMRRREKELDAVMSSLSTVELDLEGQVLKANPVFLGITGYSMSDIKGKPYTSLIPQHSNDLIQYQVMWNSILSGQSFSGEFRIVNKEKKELWITGNFTPILSESGQPYKVMVISLFTTQDKEKLLELQEMVTAFKNCFPMAEISQDMTFKSANDLFLSELGIKRLELKRTLPQNVLANGSYGKLEQFLSNHQDQANHVELNIRNKNGATKKFSTSLIKINNTNDQQKKGLLILRNVL